MVWSSVEVCRSSIPGTKKRKDCPWGACHIVRICSWALPGLVAASGLLSVELFGTPDNRLHVQGEQHPGAVSAKNGTQNN